MWRKKKEKEKEKKKRNRDGKSYLLEHSHGWWSHKFSNMALQKTTLFILHFHFTKHPISVVLFYLSTQ